MLFHLIYFLLVGLAAGWLASLVMKDHRFGILGNLAVGVVGAVLGGVLFCLVGHLMVGLVGSLISATVGAILLLFILEKVKG
jgi:uncharacterized membrane protein YeaQ/YmgE (transglycosylase-associated protein family)